MEDGGWRRSAVRRRDVSGIARPGARAPVLPFPVAGRAATRPPRPPPLNVTRTGHRPRRAPTQFTKYLQPNQPARPRCNAPFRRRAARIAPTPPHAGPTKPRPPHCPRRAPRRPAPTTPNNRPLRSIQCPLHRAQRPLRPMQRPRHRAQGPLRPAHKAVGSTPSPLRSTQKPLRRAQGPVHRSQLPRHRAIRGNDGARQRVEWA
jgi:hypothetical protein